MKLEIGCITINEVQFGAKTEIVGDRLIINRPALVSLLERDRRLTGVSIELAHPGEKTRICRICDVIEPRARTGKRKGEFPFPGALGVRGTAGEGSLNALKGVAVVLSDQGGPYLASYDMGGPFENTPIGNVIDMSGAGAEASPFGKTHNVVVIAFPAEGVHEEEYCVALKIAGLKAAAYLGKASEDLRPDAAKEYSLPAVPDLALHCKNLPKVGFIFQAHWGQFYAIAGEPIYYGDDMRRHLPTIIHPNEVLDGALVRSYFGMGTSTYTFQNHPIISELYRRHGKDLCFMGVILDMSICFEPERERATTISANLSKHILGLDGVVLNKFGGGAPMVDTSQRALACERLGVKTVIIMGDITYADGGSGLLFNQPECSAMVTTGSLVMPIPLDAQERVIGRPGDAEPPANGAMPVNLMKVVGAGDQMGFSRVRTHFTCEGIKQELVEKTGAERAVDMLVAKVAGSHFTSEIALPTFVHPNPAAPVQDMANAKIALVTSGGLIPRGNPDKLSPGFSKSFGVYSVKDRNRLTGYEWRAYHIGFRTHYVDEDPMRLLPLDVMRDLEKEGVIGSLSDTFYSFAGVVTSVGDAQMIAQGIIEMLKTDGVDGVILTAT